MTGRGGRVARALMVAVAALVVLPLIGIMLIALQRPGQVGLTIGVHAPSLESLRLAWRQGEFFRSLSTSAVVATSSMLLATLLSLPAAFGLARFPFRGRPVVLAVVLLGLVFPVEGFVVPLYFELQRLSLLDSYPGLILPEVAFALPFGIFWLRSAIQDLPPELLDAARVDGAGPITILSLIIVPLLRPAILALMTLVFVWTWNDFLLPLVILSGETLRTAPLSVALFVGQRSTDLPSLAAAACIVSAPSVLVFLFFQREFETGMLGAAVKG